ncbi:DNA polymerase III subunit delta' [Parendozoicomonas haliclonae]|uniref:DNA polymerase III subunit delta' n=1 Tax=Parendozoicomonas haliclonae TaxID=1960125 RepID=A0A1X7AMF7_9GAMM|nr:DNA polymerase III subunit delta' [Parendozoicomonas haliclonae]SMA49152.1 DNA polymerase III subunit delta' [Parendozoicomonas haliclonae]
MPSKSGSSKSDTSVPENRLVEPMSWQTDNWQQLSRRLAEDQLPHALLLKGQTGVGKRQFALAFAQYVLCQNKQGEKICGQCRNCLLNKAGTHPDLLLIEPEERGKQIKVAQVRHMIEFTEKTPQQGGYRVVVLCPAEGMNTSSANALLKCLEEPGRDTLMLLVSEQVSSLLPTIRSRCQQILFSRPSTDEALQWLAHAIPDQERARTLLQLAAGEPSTALRYDKEGLLDQRDAMKSTLAELTRGQKTPAEIAIKWQNYDAVVVLEWLTLWLQEMIRYSAAQDKQFLATEDMQKMLAYIADRAGQKTLLETHAWLVKQRSLMLSQVNLNKQLLLESVLTRWLGLSV